MLVDVGFKSEGTISADEWDDDEDRRRSAATIKVLIEEMEDDLGLADDPHGMVRLSKRKAEKILQWEKMMKTVQEGQVVTGTVTRKIKGGLLVDIGVNVFLPASQVDIRRPARHRRLHRPRRAVRSAEDRRSAAQHRGQPPLADREAAARKTANSCSANWKSASSARAWSRTSPTSARSSTWAASTACCTSPT